MHMCFDKQVSFYEFIPQTHTFSDTGKKKMLFSSPGRPEAGLGDTGREESSDVWDSQCLTGELSKQIPSGGS